MLQGTAKKKDFFLNEEDKTPDLRSSESGGRLCSGSVMDEDSDPGRKKPGRDKEANCTPQVLAPKSGSNSTSREEAVLGCYSYTWLTIKHCKSRRLGPGQLPAKSNPGMCGLTEGRGAPGRFQPQQLPLGTEPLGSQ